MHCFLSILFFLFLFSQTRGNLFQRAEYHQLLELECHTCRTLDYYLAQQPRYDFCLSEVNFAKCFPHFHPQTQKGEWHNVCQKQCERMWPWDFAAQNDILILEDSNYSFPDTEDNYVHSRGFSTCASFCSSIFYIQHARDYLQKFEPSTHKQISTNDTCITLGYCQSPNQFSFAQKTSPTSQKYRGAVLMHGHASDSRSMDDIKDWLEADFPGIYVKNMEIGDGFLSSIFMNLNKQVEAYAHNVQNDTLLVESKSINILGFSMGTLVSRGYVERFNVIPAYNAVSLAGPQSGQFGLSILPTWLQSWIDKYLREVPYDAWLQDTFTFAQVWRDPFKPTQFLHRCIFLPDLNNMKEMKSQLYKKNLESLNAYSLVYSPSDEIIAPPASGWFEFFAWNSTNITVPWDHMPIYEENWLGLKTLQDEQRLFHNVTTCLHSENHLIQCKTFFDKYAAHLFNNSADE